MTNGYEKTVALLIGIQRHDKVIFCQGPDGYLEIESLLVRDGATFRSKSLVSSEAILETGGAIIAHNLSQHLESVEKAAAIRRRVNG